MSLTLDNYILGETSNTIKIDSSEDVSDGVLALIKQSKRSIDIFSHSLDRRVYNSQTIYSAALKLATYSRYSQIRIILKESNDAVKLGSRLVELSQRLSSRVFIRKPPIEYRDHNQEFLIADDIGLIHRNLATRYESELCFYEPLKCRQLKKFFDECWEKSAPDPDLRRLHL